MTAESPRSYQDTPYVNWRHVSIPAELESVRPMGDFVLVRVVPEPDMHAGLIVLPSNRRERGYQPPRVGEVIACGPGDKTIGLKCGECGAETQRSKEGGAWCHACGEVALEPTGDTGRFPMHVKPGDKVLFWRAPSNGVVLDGQLYHFLHEEQHILAVIEQ